MDCGSPCTKSNFVGSTQGGTSLTVFGTGFDFQNWDNNRVFVGDIEAKITDGVVEDTSITFETKSSGSENDKNNLEIKVRTYKGNTFS